MASVREVLCLSFGSTLVNLDLIETAPCCQGQLYGTKQALQDPQKTPQRGKNEDFFNTGF